MQPVRKPVTFKARSLVQRLILMLSFTAVLPGCATFDRIIGYKRHPACESCESCGSPVLSHDAQHVGDPLRLPADPYNDVHNPPHPQDSSDQVYAPARPGHRPDTNSQPSAGQLAAIDSAAEAASGQEDLQQVKTEIQELKDMISQATTDRDVLERRVTSLNTVVKGIQQENQLLQQQLEDIEEKATLQHQIEMEKLLAIQRFVDRLERSHTSTAAAAAPNFQ